MKRQPLTVLVPCRNERLNIGPCIESFHNIADEILIADSLSDDDTVALAKRYSKVRVIEREYRFSGDFKNWAIGHATHPWVLLFDADERATKDLKQEVLAILAADSMEAGRTDLADGYWIRRDNHFMGQRLKHGNAATDRVLRLFRRDVGLYEGPSDHGEISISTGSVAELKSHMLHFSFWTYDDWLRKHDRYTALQASQWHEEGRDTSYFKLLVRPAWRFFREYIIQGGIFDGKAGLQLSWLAAFYCFLKQARLWQLNHGQPRPIPENLPELPRSLDGTAEKGRYTKNEELHDRDSFSTENLSANTAPRSEVTRRAG